MNSSNLIIIWGIGSGKQTMPAACDWVATTIAVSYCMMFGFWPLVS